MLKKYSILLGKMFLVLVISVETVNLLQAQETLGKQVTEPVANMSPIPATPQDGLVCLLPERYHHDLDGTFWRLSKLNGETPPEKLDITLTFHNGTAAGYAGCNSYTGIFVNPTTTLFGIQDIKTTERQCLEAVCPTFVDGGNWEEKYLAVLSKMVKVEKTATGLKLSDSEGKLTTVFESLESHLPPPTLSRAEGG